MPSNSRRRPWYKNPAILIAIGTLILAVPASVYYSTLLLAPHESEENFKPNVQLWNTADIAIMQSNRYQNKWDSSLCIFMTYLIPHDSLVALNKTEFIQDPNLQFKLLADAPEKPSVTVLSSSPKFLGRGEGNTTMCFPLVVVVWLNPEFSTREREIVLGKLEFLINVTDTASMTALVLNNTALVVWRNRS
jgi:hypothetical protein